MAATKEVNVRWTGSMASWHRNLPEYKQQLKKALNRPKGRTVLCLRINSLEEYELYCSLLHEFESDNGRTQKELVVVLKHKPQLLHPVLQQNSTTITELRLCPTIRVTQGATANCLPRLVKGMTGLVNLKCLHLYSFDDRPQNSELISAIFSGLADPECRLRLDRLLLLMPTPSQVTGLQNLLESPSCSRLTDFGAIVENEAFLSDACFGLRNSSARLETLYMRFIVPNAANVNYRLLALLLQSGAASSLESLGLHCAKSSPTDPTHARAIVSAVACQVNLKALGTRDLFGNLLASDANTLLSLLIRTINKDIQQLLVCEKTVTNAKGVKKNIRRLHGIRELDFGLHKKNKTQLFASPKKGRHSILTTLVALTLALETSQHWDAFSRALGALDPEHIALTSLWVTSTSRKDRPTSTMCFCEVVIACPNLRKLRMDIPCYYREYSCLLRSKSIRSLFLKMGTFEDPQPFVDNMGENAVLTEFEFDQADGFFADLMGVYVERNGSVMTVADTLALQGDGTTLPEVPSHFLSCQRTTILFHVLRNKPDLFIHALRVEATSCDRRPGPLDAMVPLPPLAVPVDSWDPEDVDLDGNPIGPGAVVRVIKYKSMGKEGKILRPFDSTRIVWWLVDGEGKPFNAEVVSFIRIGYVPVDGVVDARRQHTHLLFRWFHQSIKFLTTLVAAWMTTTK